MKKEGGKFGCPAFRRGRRFPCCGISNRFFARTDDIVDGTGCTHSGGASVTVSACFGTDGQMIMNNGAYGGNIKSAGRKVCCNHDWGSPVGEEVNGRFALLLVKGAMIEYGGEAPFLDVLKHSLGAFPMVDKHHCALMGQPQEQGLEGRELVGLG